jgi:transcription elongation factor Elf1
MKMAKINCPICKKETVMKPNQDSGAIHDGFKSCDICGGAFEFRNNDGALTTYYGDKRFWLNGEQRKY